TRHRLRSWLMTSEVAERAEVRNRRALNDTRPIEADDKWANVARNLSQQPEKEIALAALDRAIKVSRGALRQFPQTMHIAEQRRQRGEPPSHAHEALAERHAQAEMQPFLDRLGETIRALRERISVPLFKQAEAVRAARQHVRQ